ncbi:MAG: hypothetical protein QNJ07_12280 [Woeseiaceae bacterium]|nr:hypothetical protein [Woeseiaceae bacterium]
MMHESEYALQSAADSPEPRIARIANTILDDSLLYSRWEATHANLLLPAAERRKNTAQLMELRQAEVQLVHRRALFHYLRKNNVTGPKRERIFRTMHTTRDFSDAVIAEHRQYMIAVSSHVSADHLIDVMKDVNSKRLLQMYEEAYARYYEMRCFIATADDGICSDLVRLAMRDAKRSLLRSQMRIKSELPVTHGGSFDREEALARSGRYPILDYMVG